MCHIVGMTPFGLRLQPGHSIFDQLVAAAHKAILNGELTEGQDFPSVRTLAVELKIHPNTAHKAVQHLIQEGWLEKRPGLGTVVAPAPDKVAEMRREQVRHRIEELVSEARRV